MKFYAGIGSRVTPIEVCCLMTKIAEALAREGYTLRSGGAAGADRAFERGAGEQKEIFSARDAEGDIRAHSIAAYYHPAYDTFTPYVKNLMARNAYQILGESLSSPVDFIVCWTPGGKTKGGTGQALRMVTKDPPHPLAKQALGIKVYNLGDTEVYDKFVAKLKRSG